MKPGASDNGGALSSGAFPPGPTEMGEGVWQNYLFYRRFFKDPLSHVTRWMETYGDVWHFKIGDDHNYAVANPDVIYELFVRQAKRFIKGPAYTSKKSGLARFMGDGLVTSNGDFEEAAASGRTGIPCDSRTCLRGHNGRLHLAAAGRLERRRLGRCRQRDDGAHADDRRADAL